MAVGCTTKCQEAFYGITRSQTVYDLDRKGVFEAARCVLLIALLILPNVGASLSPEAMGGMIIGLSTTAFLIHLLQPLPRVDGCTGRVLNTKNSKIVSAIATVLFIAIGALHAAGVMPPTYIDGIVSVLWFANIIGQFVMAPKVTT